MTVARTMLPERGTIVACPTQDLGQVAKAKIQVMSEVMMLMHGGRQC